MGKHRTNDLKNNKAQNSCFIQLKHITQTFWTQTRKNNFLLGQSQEGLLNPEFSMSRQNIMAAHIINN